MSDEDTTTKVDEFQVQGEEVIAKVKELIKEGNVRRISIVGADGKTIVEIPLTIGVVGALLAPPLAAIGAVAALVTDCTIKVVRTETEPAGDGDE